nr:2-oxoacid:acceptor oxidoreductase subunit alpha [Gemmatimonadaceae bacterium]
APIVTVQPGAEIGLVTIGGCDVAVREAAARLAERGIAVDVMRVRGFPFAETVRDFIDQHDEVFVIEQNRDAQLRALLAIELGIPRDRMRSVLDYGGLPLTADVVVQAVVATHEGVAA